MNDNNNRPDPIVEKIELTKEEQDLIDKISKREPIKKTRVFTNKMGYTYEHTRSEPLPYSLVRKRLTELYGGTCISCGQWPSYKVSHDVGDELQPAKLVERYCSSCFEKSGIK